MASAHSPGVETGYVVMKSNERGGRGCLIRTPRVGRLLSVISHERRLRVAG